MLDADRAHRLSTASIGSPPRVRRTRQHGSNAGQPDVDGEARPRRLDAAIVTGPGLLTNSRSASFILESEPGARFECALDGSAFGACSALATLANLSLGGHAFAARALDAAGNADRRAGGPGPGQSRRPRPRQLGRLPGDCDDNATVHPGARESPQDRVDQDCSPQRRVSALRVSARIAVGFLAAVITSLTVETSPERTNIRVSCRDRNRSIHRPAHNAEPARQRPHDPCCHDNAALRQGAVVEVRIAERRSASSPVWRAQRPCAEPEHGALPGPARLTARRLLTPSRTRRGPASLHTLRGLPGAVLPLHLRQVRAHGCGELVRERRERADCPFTRGSAPAARLCRRAHGARTARTNSSERSRNSRAAGAPSRRSGRSAAVGVERAQPPDRRLVGGGVVVARRDQPVPARS